MATTAAVVLGTADGRRADPAATGIRRLVHRPGGVLAHWRRDGCGQPGQGTINAAARPSVDDAGAAAVTVTTVSYAAHTLYNITKLYIMYNTHVTN